MFSIVIPTYNRLIQLERCIFNLSLQTYTGTFEVIIVNDDVNNPLDKELFEKHNYQFDIVICNNIKNVGAGGSRNNGAKVAKYEWLMFLDDDDLFDKDKLLEVFQVISGNKVDFVVNSALIRLLDENVEYKTIPKPSKESVLSHNCMGGAPLLTVSKSVFQVLNGYDYNLRALEDYELNIRLLQGGYKFSVINSPLTICNYRSEIGSVSKSVENNLKALAYIHNKHKISKDSPDFFNSYAWLYAALAYKSILLGDGSSRSLFIKSFLKKKSLKTFLCILICYVNSKFLLKLRAFL
jgi:GT2 family glycosyltransferase